MDPVHCVPMKDPHVLACGHTFDKSFIDAHFRQHATCPMGCAVEKASNPNYSLKYAMEQDMKRQPAIKSMELAARLLTEQQVEHADSCATPGGNDAADFAEVGSFLSSIGLGRYIDVFRTDAWDNMAMLARITQEDKKEMGIFQGGTAVCC